MNIKNLFKLFFQKWKKLPKQPQVVVVEKPIVEKPAEKVIQKKPLEKSIVEQMAIEYLVSEMLKHSPNERKSTVYNSFSGWEKEELKLLVFIISKQFRRNCIYDFLFEKELDWRMGNIDRKNIFFTGINEKTNVILNQYDYSLEKIVFASVRNELPEDFELGQNKGKIEKFKPFE